VGFAGYLREDCFQGETNTLQVEVFNFVHLSHSASCDEANDEKAIPEDIAGSGTVCGFQRRSDLIGCIAAVCFKALSKIDCCFEKTSPRMLERASRAGIGTGIFDEQVLDRTLEFQISAANFIEEGRPVPGLDCQRGIEELLGQLMLISHNPHSNKRCE